MKSLESIKRIEKCLLNNDEELLNIVNEVNSYNGSLDFLAYWENDEDFFNTFFSDNPMEVARATFYGDYKYFDPYVRFNGDGNLESFDEYELIEECKYYIDELVDGLLDCWEYIDIYNEELLTLLSEEDEEEEEEE